MQEMAYYYLKPNSLVHKKLVMNSEIIDKQRKEMLSQMLEQLKKQNLGMADSDFED